MGRHRFDVLKQFLLTQIIEEELHAQALNLESLNTTLYHTQMELRREVSPDWSGSGRQEEPSSLCSSTLDDSGLGKRAIKVNVFQKAVVGNVEKTLQAKLAEAEEKFKYTIQLLTEENTHLRCE